MEAIKTELSQAEVAHFDETSLRVEHKLHWVHVASTETLTYYHLDPKRGQAGMTEAGILPTFGGQAVHDHWKSYFTFDQCAHVLCNAHHLRELRFVAEQYQQPWATEMAQLLLDIKQAVAQAPPDLTKLPDPQRQAFDQRFDDLIEKGLNDNPLPEQPPPNKRGQHKQTPAKNLLDRLKNHKHQLLALLNGIFGCLSSNRKSLVAFAPVTGAKPSVTFVATSWREGLRQTEGGQRNTGKSSNI